MNHPERVRSLTLYQPVVFGMPPQGCAHRPGAGRDRRRGASVAALVKAGPGRSKPVKVAMQHACLSAIRVAATTGRLSQKASAGVVLHAMRHLRKPTDLPL